jgi:hypothetical protein
MQYYLNAVRHEMFRDPVYIRLRPDDGRWRVGSVIESRLGQW